MADEAAKAGLGPIIKEAPAGSGRWYLDNDVCATMLGCARGVKLWDNGTMADVVLVGRVTAWVRARLK